MRRVLVPILVGCFLWSSMDAWGTQGSAAPVTVNSQDRADQNSTRDTAQNCSSFVDALRVASLAVQRDERALPPASGASSAIPTNNDGPLPGNLQEDLSVLGKKETELSQCSALSNLPDAMPAPPMGCSSERLFNFQMSHHGELEREIPIWHLPGSPVFFYESGMTIDADGAPNAYHPDNTGLDDLANAGSPENWQGLAKNANGEPFVQGPDDPFPGYYVSATALTDRTKPMDNPAHYVDSTKIPYIVMPGNIARQFGASPGDFAAVTNLRNGMTSYAIFGDVGPWDRIGEGSIALAENLGIRSDARNGGTPRGILYLVFPGSGNGRPRSVEEINAETEKLVQAWGGNSQMTACTPQQFSYPFEGNRSAN
jgi:hypothetical protein